LSGRDKVTQRLEKIDEADKIFVSLFSIFAFLKNDNAGVDIGFFEPALHLGLDNGNDFVVIKEKFLKSLAIVHIQPGIGNDKAEATAILEKFRSVNKEVSVDTGSFGNFGNSFPF
jgi:hypothetical protein